MEDSEAVWVPGKTKNKEVTEIQVNKTIFKMLRNKMVDKSCSDIPHMVLLIYQLNLGSRRSVSKFTDFPFTTSIFLTNLEACATPRNSWNRVRN